MVLGRSKGVIDLRQRSGKRPPRGQAPLFSVRPPRTPEPPRRPMPLRARRRRVRALGVLGILVLCGAVFYGVNWVSYLPKFNVSSVSISGAHGVSEELIRRRVETVLDDGSFHILSRRSIFLYPRKSLEEEIVNAFPPIRFVHITRPSFFSTSIVITVDERQAFARWCADVQTNCYFFDDTGFIYTSVDTTASSTSQATSSTSYVFSGGIASSTDPIGQSFIRAHLPGLISFLKFLGQAGFASMGARVENDQDFFVDLQDGFTLKASYGADASTLVKNLQLVLSSDVLQGKRASLEYIDLRFGNRVYYKLKGQAETSTQ